MRIGLNEFVEKIMQYNEEGNKATLEHKEKYPFHKSKKKQERTGYHAPGIKADCPECIAILASYEKIMDLQKECFGINGIPVDSLIAAIKITKATIEMMRIDERG